MAPEADVEAPSGDRPTTAPNGPEALPRPLPEAVAVIGTIVTVLRACVVEALPVWVEANELSVTVFNAPLLAALPETEAVKLVIVMLLVTLADLEALPVTVAPKVVVVKVVSVVETVAFELPDTMLPNVETVMV